MKYQSQCWSANNWLRLRVWVCKILGHRVETNQYNITACMRCGEQQWPPEQTETCPYCGADLQGEPIPEQLQASFGATHASRKIGLYSLEKDMTYAYECPDCGKTWSKNE